MRVRIDAPADLDSFELAQALVGPNLLLKAEYGARTFRRWLAMDELHKLVAKAYDSQIAKLLSAIREYVDKHVLHRTGPHMFTPTSIDDIQQLISDYHAAFVAGAIHPSALPAGAVQQLMDKGILPPDLAFTHHPGPGEKPPEAMHFIDAAFSYGRSLIPVRSVVRGPDPMTTTLDAVQKRPEIPLSLEEQHAMDWARHNAAIHVKGLGDRIGHDFGTLASEIDKDQKARYQELIRDKLEANIAKRESWRKLASDLGHASSDWSRDLQRIAATEKQRAMQEGIAAGLKEREGKDPKDIFVAKQPNNDACDDCVRLHLTAGSGSPPRIFRLSELKSNGSNVGRKRAAWKAGVGPVHPWCSCELIHVPEGWKFDSDGNLMPEFMKRSGYLDSDLRKAHDMAYTASVPDVGVAIRVADPRLRAAVEQIIARTPSVIFNKQIGVTLITTDMPRVQNPLDDHDLAYWTGNEIRLMHNIPPERVERVLPHEIGHSLNVYLMRKLGGTDPVRAWHDDLWRVSEQEGFVSDYAKKLPIENAAEISMLYIYNRKRLMLVFPRQFAFVHKFYAPIFRKARRAADPRPEQSP